MSSVPCSTCGNPALFVCSLCPSDDLASAAKYCSEACQRSHWPTHRQEHASATAATPAAASPSNQTNDYDPDCDSTALSRQRLQQRKEPPKQEEEEAAIRVLDSDTIDDLKYYLSQIYSIVKPVVACIIFAILWVKLLNPPSQYYDHAYTSPPDIYALNYGGGNVNSNVTNTVINPGRETTEQQHADLLMALKTLGSVVAATVVIFVLFYFNCMKVYSVWNLWFHYSWYLGLFTYSVSVSLLWLYLVPFDYITFFFLLWNFVAGPLILQQSYLVVMSSLMVCFIFLCIHVDNPAVPPITSWILLALLAVWDLIAVLCPYGPLRLLIEASQKHNREIPAILYSAGPTTMMASPDPSRSSQGKNQQQPNNNNTNDNDDDDEDGNGGMKLALSDWISTSSVTIALLTGLNFTIFLLVIWRKALPALPFSIAFGLLFYFSTGVCLVPFYGNEARAASSG
ncbi:Presenilin-domain-containing protein [Rhizoclosmatium globosum]|uniref:Presenilin-domain-containing protein n=1 Tax=Rhizoclosmatium globosum TaxID=329046 RepID=A0A1Y2CXC9_9FUNG|nr:Presenilin-domain-containing protein [Rhizoclosmatium globosum]|eukprot:ORY51546.1 Presenilin-domain-containing protein [Rhizoclosmatium globosum]